MFYLRFVIWLLRTTYMGAARLDQNLWGDTSKYSRSLARTLVISPLGKLAVTIVGLTVTIPPIAGYMYLVSLLPVSGTVEWLIDMISAFTALGLIGHYLIKHAGPPYIP